MRNQLRGPPKLALGRQQILLRGAGGRYKVDTIKGIEPAPLFLDRRIRQGCKGIPALEAGCRVNGWVRSRSARQLAGALLALAVTWLCAPPSARAECGDYVIRGGHASTQTAAPEGDVPDGLLLAVPLGPGYPAPVRNACQGLQCSRRPALPLPPVTVTGWNAEQWGCPPVPALVPGPDGAARPVHEGRLHPRRRSCGIYHPPRAWRLI